MLGAKCHLMDVLLVQPFMQSASLQINSDQMAQHFETSDIEQSQNGT